MHIARARPFFVVVPVALGCSDGGQGGGGGGGGAGAGAGGSSGAGAGTSAGASSGLGGSGATGGSVSDGPACVAEGDPALGVTIENAPAGCEGVSVIASRGSASFPLSCSVLDAAASGVVGCYCEGPPGETGRFIVSYREGGSNEVLASSGSVFVTAGDNGCDPEQVQIVLTLRPRDDEPPPASGGADAGVDAGDGGA